MFSERIERLTGSLIREILALTQRDGVISFAGGLPATEAMPDLDLAAAPQHLRQYGTTEGEPSLRVRIAADLTRIGRACEADQVLITAGSQQGIDLTSKLFIDPGTPVMLEAPSYLAAIQSFRLFGARFIALPLSPSGIDPASLADSIERQRPAFVYLIPTFQNPSGYCYCESTRTEVGEVLDNARVPLIEDEPYRELRYGTAEHVPICGRLKSSSWVYLGSLSKTGLPGLRIGYAAASRDVYPLLVRLKQSADLHSSRLGQWWADRFLGSSDYPEHLEALRASYRARRDAMASALDRHFRDLGKWELPTGGLFFWVQLNRLLDSRELLSKALEHDVAFMPGEPFFPDEDRPRGFLRLNFSNAGDEAIERGIGILAQVVRNAHA
ncbi:MAG: PLP-dependent aminotransferase family protein [Gammaproteobacteria bacterium]|nr:PLP-dependent aminotransferase family protein [Gammaproteobacteria bacterium]